MGVGGGVILVPLLVYALHLEQHEAQGTSLAFTIVTALVAIVPYYGHERLDVALALWLAAGAVPGVILGSRLASQTSPARLRVVFGALVLVTGIRMLAGPPLAHAGAGVWPPALNLLLGAVVGTFAGFVGIGGGTVLVPILVLGQNIDQHTAQGISLLMIIPVGVVGVVSYARRGTIVVRGLPALLAGGAVGALAGALLAHRTKAPTLTRLFALLLLTTAAQMIFGRARGNVPRSAEPSGGIP